jgi:hypothetical protein
MLLKHNGIREEAEDVVFKNPLPKRGKTRKRLVLLGETEGKRLLEVVLENKGKVSGIRLLHMTQAMRIKHCMNEREEVKKNNDTNK